LIFSERYSAKYIICGINGTSPTYEPSGKYGKKSKKPCQDDLSSDFVPYQKIKKSEVMSDYEGIY
jgi:hypothetical protein